MKTRDVIYNEICQILTDYEGYGGEPPTMEDFYDILLQIQVNWDDIRRDD